MFQSSLSSKHLDIYHLTVEGSKLLRIVFHAARLDSSPRNEAGNFYAALRGKAGYQISVHHVQVRLHGRVAGNGVDKLNSILVARLFLDLLFSGSHIFYKAENPLPHFTDTLKRCSADSRTHGVPVDSLVVDLGKIIAAKLLYQILVALCVAM